MSSAALAAPALAADDRSVEQTGLTQAVAIGDSLADADRRPGRRPAAGRRRGRGAKAKAEAAAKTQAEEARRKAAAKAKASARPRSAPPARPSASASTPSSRPIAGSYVSTGYKAGGGLWSSGSHTGIDFHAASGTSVHAVGAGTVVEAGWGGAYGNNIVIKMNDGTYTQYGHLSSIGVSVGQTVTPGQQIGLSGATGNITGPHLHFEARTSAEYGSDIDPVAYLRSHGVNV